MNVEEAQLSMNIFDAVILGVMALSIVVAFFRGFVREILSLGAWVGAAVITIYLFPQSTQLMKNYIKSEHIASGSAALGTYLCALITLSLINSVIIKYVKTGSEVGIIDNILGMGFGAIRGAFIVSLAFLIMSAVIPKENPPKWLKSSVTKPYLQDGAQMLAKIAPRYLSNLQDIVKQQQDRDQKNTKESDVENAAPEDAQDNVNGTKSNTRKALESLMNSSQQPREGSENDNQ